MYSESTFLVRRYRYTRHASRTAVWIYVGGSVRTFNAAALTHDSIRHEKQRACLFLTCRFPPQAFVIYSHLRQTRLLDPLNAPFQLHAAVTYTPAHGRALPTWPCVSLASSLGLAAPATPKKVWLGWYYAVLDLAIHVIVIVQLELTLRWNGVRGLSGLWTSVGQLVPFIIGVAGLALVGSRWAVRAWVKWTKKAGGSRGWEKDGVLDSEGAVHSLGDEAFGLEEHVREGYARWRDRYVML